MNTRIIWPDKQSRPDKPAPKPHRTWFKPKATGLGDVVAAGAQPLAGAIDAVAGTDIKNCGGCARRRATLNRIVPDLSNPFKKG